MEENNELIRFDLPEKPSCIIKVVGVGGGGGNAVNHMYRKGIKDVSYLICNTDQQVLLTSPIPDKLQLGPQRTKGLGAGNKPEVAKEAAEESQEDIKEALSDGTKMVFVTAGMGGGTGTGASPVVAKVAHELGILTVGIVTIPFEWEGMTKVNQALDGVDAISKEVDALLVINNNTLIKLFPDISVITAFKNADDVLCTAAKSIAEIITKEGHINLDFADVDTVLRGGGVAVMSTGEAKGDQRLNKALQHAIESPLLNNNDVFKARKLLFYITYNPKHELKMEELSQVKQFMERFGDHVEEVIWGLGPDESLNEELRVTLLASGFMFGHDNRSKASQQTPEEVAEDAMKRARREAQIKEYYGDDGDKRRQTVTPRVMTEKEMDDDTLIMLLTEEPANHRTKH